MNFPQKNPLIISLLALLMSAASMVFAHEPGEAVLSLTPAEMVWLENHKTIRVGIAPVIPPLKFSEQGVIKGIEPDYLDLLTQITDIQFKYVISDFPSMDAKLKSGEMDMFISFNIPERLEYSLFTDPLMEFRQVIITRNDAPFISGIGALKGKRLAAIKGVRLYDKLFASYPDLEIVQVDSMEQMFKAVSEFRADAFITKTFYAGYLINRYPNLKIAGVADLPPEPYLYAVRKDYPELVSILNKAIKSIPTDKHDAIVQKWFNVRIEYQPNWNQILKWAFAVGIIFSMILGLVVFSNRRLRREIDSRLNAEKSLRDSEQCYQLLLANMFEGVVLHQMVFDTEGKPVEYRIVEVNDQYEKILGLQREDVIGKLSREAYGTALVPYLERYSQVVQGKKACRFEDYFAPLDQYFSISVTPWGEQGFATIFTDITEQKKTEEQLISLNADLGERVEQEIQKRILDMRLLTRQGRHAAMGEMIGAIAHQWRQPLSTVSVIIQNMAAAWKLDRLSREYVDQALEVAQRQVAYMTSTIEEFLNFFRPDKQKEVFCVNDKIMESLAFVEWQFQSQGIVIIDGRGVQRTTLCCWLPE